jgi:guanine deaminase
MSECKAVEQAASEPEDAFMRRAIELSRQAMDEGAGPPFGAVIVHDGQVVAEGHNDSFVTNDPTAHAEIVAIRRACKAMGSRSLKGCVIYSSAEPCPMCLGAIYWSGMGRVYYGNDRTTAAAAGFDDERLYREIALPVEDRALPMVRQLAEEAKAVFDAWQAKIGNAGTTS